MIYIEIHPDMITRICKNVLKGKNKQNAVFIDTAFTNTSKDARDMHINTQLSGYFYFLDHTHAKFLPGLSLSALVRVHNQYYNHTYRMCEFCTYDYGILLL